MPPKAKAPAATRNGQFACPDCDKPFTRKEYVERHRRLKHEDDQLAHDDDDAALQFASGAAASAPQHQSDAFSYPSVASTSSNLSPHLLPSLSPPGDSSGGSATSANSPKTPPTGLDLHYSTSASGPELACSDSTTSYANNAFSDPTLAPSMVPMRTTFTQDEILASEVLEDLLRSPQYSRYTPSPDAYRSLGSPEPSQSDIHSSEPPKPWHGALALENSGNEAAEVMGYWEGGSLDQDDDPARNNGIEFSPEAQALASYFNAGGVGGISALDLGFTYTPSLYPDHLFTPNNPDPDDSRFFLPTQRFCVGYLYPWSVPPIKTLSRFAKNAATSFLPSVPVLHPASMVMAEMPTHTAFALTVTGAAYEAEGETFSNEMLVEKRVFLVRGFNKPGNTDTDKFSSLQSMLLYQLLGLFHKDEQQRQLSHTFHAALVMMLRQLDVPSKVRQASLAPVEIGLSGDALDAAWKAWIQVETWRRVAFIVYLADLETATHTSAPPLLPFAELALELPASDNLWNATSSLDWLHKSLSAPASSGVKFLDAIRALIAPTPPSPFSADGILLTKLSSLSTFPLLVLSRTLSFLQMKTEEAIRQVDPFRALLGGVGAFDGKEEENHAVLRRIINGRTTLKNLPGGQKLGGGEQWFENVMPSAAASKPPANVISEEDDPPPKTSNWTSPQPSHFKRAAEGVYSTFPSSSFSA
ncbi:hypothetical protein RQP46_000708 [Phenoliferia psychrophenolica]